MNAIWNEVPRVRPDPYLEWEYRTRTADNGPDLFCSLQIAILPTPSYRANLHALARAVDAGRLEGDVRSDTIRMAIDERRHLDRVIASNPGEDVDPVLVQFFVYRREALIYANGAYAHTPIYKAIIAGPPIDGLTYNEPRVGAQAFDFGGGHANDTVAIGIVDDGIGFAHERFCSAPDSSRVYALWVQEVEQAISQDGGVLFGHRLKRKEIDKLLRECRSEEQIYRKLGIIDFRMNRYNPLAARASHGTHVLDLAAGYEHAFEQPPRPILGVQLPSVATIDTSGVTMGSYVLQAVRMIMVWADTIIRDDGKPVPLVINFSYGILAGPKDGTQHLEHALAKLIEFRNRKTPTALVLPSGNSYRVRTTARVTLEEKESRELEWVALPDAAAPNFIEMWFDEVDPECMSAPVEITLATPDGYCGDSVRLRQDAIRLLVIDGRPIAGMCYDVACETRRGRIFLAVGPSVRNEKDWPIAPAGRWNVSLANRVAAPITAHWYVQRDDTPFGYPRRGRQSFLDDDNAYVRDCKTGDYREYGDGPLTHEETLSAIATAPCAATVVGAAEATDEFAEATGECPPSDYASSGPTVSREEPDCSAIADDGDAHWGILAAGTLSGSIVPMRGSSVAAPQIVRELADELAAGSSGAATQVAVTGGPPVPRPAPTNTISVSADDKPRLGEFVLTPVPRPWIPKRRYPAL